MRSFMKSCTRSVMKRRQAKLLNNDGIVIERHSNKAQPIACRSFMTAFDDRNSCQNRLSKFHETSHETFHRTVTTCGRSLTVPFTFFVVWILKGSRNRLRMRGLRGDRKDA